MLAPIFDCVAVCWDRFKVTERKMCILIFSGNFVQNISLPKKNERVTIKFYIGLHLKKPYIISDFNPFPVQFKSLVPGQKSRVLSRHI